MRAAAGNGRPRSIRALDLDAFQIGACAAPRRAVPDRAHRDPSYFLGPTDQTMIEAAAVFLVAFAR